MTKYILHGGKITKENKLNQKFFSEIAKNLGKGDKILMCYFAPSEKDNLLEIEKFKKGVELFNKNIPNKKLEFIFAERANFIKQLKKADVLYIHGGGTEKLFQDLQKYPDFIKELKKKKLVVGSSAGAYVLAKYSVDYAHESKAQKRFGFLPIKIYCHYKDKDKEILKEKFTKVDPENKFELVLLRDFETKIFKD